MNTAPEAPEPTEPLDTEEPIPGLTDPGPWQKLPQESPKSYAAFTRYLEMGPDITLQQLAEATGKSFGAVANLSSRHQWLERAAAYRQHVSHCLLSAASRDQAKQAELWRLRVQVFREQQWEAIQQLMLLGRQARNQLLRNPEREIAYYELARLEDTICRLGKVAGVNAERAEEQTKLSIHPDVEAAMEKIYGESFDIQ